MTTNTAALPENKGKVGYNSDEESRKFNMLPREPLNYSVPGPRPGGPIKPPVSGPVRGTGPRGDGSQTSTSTK
ncbi:hypothetical protein GYMLUDRAFT_41801 [Collybiopsis luxurians FD-317 M1]|uniref:Uncharacterized protein n=1 Tax=Collybiopsis luxurians FD-317 M1 TaxID=944289 RepID=A0A0D0BF01_9AGAR|nr:hypothetical protein GYMLUDRAFT_41801 [Collybiopsis luxurians FD-317 M1]